MKKNSKSDLIKEQIEKEEINSYPGYPLYPASDDIYTKFRKDELIDPEEAAEMQDSMDKAKVHTRNEKDFDDDVSGDDLDVPGSELDNQQENIGSEDEENNYYSLGGDDHNDLEEDRGDIIIAPFSTVQKRMMSSSMYINSILASGKSEGQVVDAVDEITILLREKHKIAPSDDNDFTVRTQSEISNVFGTISKVMTILLASIASISLLVGGIGIMNIMLVSVTERTREIGIRMAIGAKGKDILTQFMIESIVISFLGGLIGILLGVVVSQVVATFGGWPVVITASSVLLSFLFSSAIGLFFGWYPARKAAALNPIDALRYE